jgi:Ca2+-binding RTX toxin-like protein
VSRAGPRQRRTGARDAAGDAYNGIENLTGGTVADVLTATTTPIFSALPATTISGGNGDDILIGGAGGDILNGRGIDTASYSTSTAVVTVNVATPASNTDSCKGSG